MRRPWFARAALVLIAAAGAAGATSFLIIQDVNAAPAPAEMPVPDPAALNPGWWDYLAPSQPGIEERIKALLGSAEKAASRLPPDQAGAAGQALARLRISLSALPAMLAARPAVPGNVPAPAENYTTSQILQLDRDIRDLQIDLDERRSAIAVSDRALTDAQRQLDADFAAYIAQSETGPQQVIDGLEVMATRAEIAVTVAEQELLLPQASVAVNVTVAAPVAPHRSLREA